MTTTELAIRHNKSTTTIARWFRNGKLNGRRRGDKGNWRLVVNQMRKGDGI